MSYYQQGGESNSYQGGESDSYQGMCINLIER